jgi:hypothetical protein
MREKKARGVQGEINPDEPCILKLRSLHDAIASLDLALIAGIAQ